MKQLHEALRKHSSFYDFWHNEPYKAVHWVVFILVAVLVTLAIIVGINGQFPRSIQSEAAQNGGQSYLLKPQRTVGIGYNNITLTILEQNSQDNVRKAKIRVTPGSGASKDFDNLKTGDSFEAFGVKFTVTVLYGFRQLAAVQVTLLDQVITNPATLSISNSSTAPIKVAETAQFSASYDPDGPGSQSSQTAQVQWSSSAANIASIAQTGLTKGLAPGNVVITAAYQGLTATAPLSVISPTASEQVDNAQFISQTTLPSTMTPGQTASVSIVMKNSGTTTWTKDKNYKLGSENPHDNLNWGIGRVELSDSDNITPGQTKTFTFTITAPTAAGSNNFQWRMLQENISWFGDLTQNASIRITNPQAAQRKIYFGAYTEDSGLGTPNVSLSEFETNAGKKVSIHGAVAWWYNDFSWGDFNTYYKGWSTDMRNRGTIPLIMWQPYQPVRADFSSVNIGEADYISWIKRYSLKSISDGNFDAYIHTWAKQIKDWGYPIMIRPMHEQNTASVNLSPGSGAISWAANMYDVDGTPINTPAVSIAAWRHIVDIFRQEGATNVSWVWSVLSWPSAASGGTNPLSMASIYPGDSYVNWIGIECYNFYGTADAQAQQECGNGIHAQAYQEASALSATKPLMMAEIGSNENAADSKAKAEWLQNAFSPSRSASIPNVYPRVKAVMYWDDGRSDLWIESSEAAKQAFKQAIGNDIYDTNNYQNLSELPN